MVEIRLSTGTSKKNGKTWYAIDYDYGDVATFRYRRRRFFISEQEYKHLVSAVPDLIILVGE